MNVLRLRIVVSELQVRENYFAFEFKDIDKWKARA